MEKILFIGMTPNKGGLETYMMNIFTKLCKNKKYSFYFINTSNKNIAYSQYILRHKGHIYNVPFYNNILKYFTRFSYAKKFFKYHHNFDIVHINALSVNQSYWVKAAKKYNIKHVIFQSHNSGIVHKSLFISFFSKIMALYNRLYFKYVHGVTKLAASRNCGEWMFHNKDFKVINNGIDTNYFYPSQYYRVKYKKKLGLNKYDKVVITTARLNHQKNYTKIVHTFYCIHNINNLIKLIIIGTGNEASHVKSMVHNLHLDKDVLFLGVQNKQNIAKLLNIGDLMLMPSYFEAVPFSLTEAQSVGVSAIVSKGHVPKDADITNNVAYISLRKSNLYWAKKAIQIISTGYSLKKRIHMNEMVENSPYNINNSIKQVNNLYLSLLKQK